MNFNLLYLILQKALGKSWESHLTTRCRQPVNRIPELCSPTTGTHPQSREPFTPADPPLPTHTWRPQFHAPWRHLQSRICAPTLTGPRQRPQTQRPPPAAKWRLIGAGQGGLRAHRATAPRPPWGPGPVSSPCNHWQRPWSQRPSKARAPRGWRSWLACLAGGGAR